MSQEQSIRRPRIGITMDAGGADEGRKVWELPKDYAASVLRAGGLPVLLVPVAEEDARRELIESVDALLIPGGRDVNPSLYGQSPHETTKLVDAERQAFDLRMLKLAEERRMPVMGICLGCQLMNVARGGTLHQHLPELKVELEHSRKGDRTNAHQIAVSEDTLLARTLPAAKALEVNSRHHQAIDRVAPGLVAGAHATDGVIESVEDPAYPGKFWLAVQWHPENLAGSPHEALFRGLVAAARDFAAR